MIKSSFGVAFHSILGRSGAFILEYGIQVYSPDLVVDIKNIWSECKNWEHANCHIFSGRETAVAGPTLSVSVTS